MDEDTESDDTDADEDVEPDADDAEEYAVAESIRSFRRAVARVSDGLEHLYHGGKKRVANQHAVVQAVLTVGLWFAGNWVYNRIAPPIFDSLASAIGSVPVEPILALIVGLLSGDVVLSTTQLLSGSVGAILAQNQFQIRKLKKMESNVIAMSKNGRTATDGGSADFEPTGGTGVGGAIAGASLGLSFGPGGVLAGIYLGFVVEVRLTRWALSDDYAERR